MLIASLDCMAIAASVCLNQTADVRIIESGNMSAARVEIGRVLLESITRSDSIVNPLVSEMRRECRSGECVYYRGHCRTTGRRRRCNLWYSWSPSEPLRRLEIAGPQAPVVAAMNSVRLTNGSRFNARLVEFQYDAEDASPPTCHERSGCPSNRR
jgi:hypothetical protein